VITNRTSTGERHLAINYHEVPTARSLLLMYVLLE